MKIESSGGGEIDQIATQPWQLWTPLSHRERLTWLVKRGILVKSMLNALNWQQFQNWRISKYP